MFTIQYTRNICKELVIKHCMNRRNNMNHYITQYKLKWFIKKDLLELHDHIIYYTNFLGDNAEYSERIYCVINDIEISPTCECSNKVEFEFYTRGYRKYCSIRCRADSEVWKKDFTEVCEERFGCHPSKLEHVKKQKIETCLENYGYENGLVYYSKTTDKSILSKQSKLNISKYVELHGTNPGWNDKGYRTRLENQTMIEMSKRPSFDQYYIRVGEFTSNTVKNFGNFIENLNLRGSHRIDNHAWHLDHKFSVFQGFNNNIPPYIIGSIYNLEMLPWQENLKNGQDVQFPKKN